MPESHRKRREREAQERELAQARVHAQWQRLADNMKNLPPGASIGFNSNAVEQGKEAEYYVTWDFGSPARGGHGTIVHDEDESHTVKYKRGQDRWGQPLQRTAWFTSLEEANKAAHEAYENDDDWQGLTYLG